MKRLIVLAALLIAGVVWAAPATESNRIEDLAWLAGCWARIGGEAGSGEQWMVPAAGTLLGVSRTVREGRTTGTEFMQIRVTGDGGMEFVAQPSGQPQAAFAMVRLSDREVVFENPDHDFPRRILYRLRGDGILHARIEGETGEGVRGIDFPMEPIACGAGQSRESDAAHLLLLHEQVLAAHRTGDIESWMEVEGDEYISANKGRITFPTAADRRSAREPYLASTTFTVYRDLRPPIVRISDDGTLAWVIAEVEIRGTEFEAIYAWIELYEQQEGAWKMIGNVSNRRP